MHVSHTRRVGVRRIGQQRPGRRLADRPGILLPQPVGFKANQSRDTGAVGEAGAGIDPVGTVGHHVRHRAVPAGPCLGAELHPNQRLLWSVDRRLAPLGGGQQRIAGGDRIDRVGCLRRLVRHQHPVGRLVAGLPVHRVRAEETEAHPRIARILGSVVHAFGPVLAVARHQHTFDAAQAARIELRVQVGTVGNVVARLLLPLDEVHLPAEEVA